MARIVKVRELRLGQGRPKVCWPLCAGDFAGMEEEFSQLPALKPDLVEWRADYFRDLGEEGVLERALALLRERLGTLPLLFTCRGEREGGAAPHSDTLRGKLAWRAVTLGGCDLVDFELDAEAPVRDEVVAAAKRSGVPVILSHHNFSATPGEEEMLEILARECRAGADVAKLAVTPRTPEDLLALLRVTQRAHRELDAALITVSMGALGALSRVGGGFFGSAVSFGSGRNPSAPGQLDAVRLREFLEALHPEE